MRLFQALAMILAVSTGCLATSATAANPDIRTYKLAVNVRSGSAAHRYAGAVLVFTYPPSYRMRIAYVGGKRDFAGTYNDIPELMGAAGSALVMNGGFYTSDPSKPAGLVLVGGRMISPPNGQSAILCVSDAGKLKILRTAAVKQRARDLPSICSDALQGYPIVVSDGQNGINAEELARSPYRRSVIGLRQDGSLVAAFFLTPINLYAAAEFLRAPVTTDRLVQVTGVAGVSMHASGGIGLIDAVNLSGVDDLFASLNGYVVVGSSYHDLPSAIVIK